LGWKLRLTAFGVVALAGAGAGVGLITLLVLAPSSPAATAARAMLADPLRLLALRSPGERPAGAMLSVKPPRPGEPRPITGPAPPPRLSVLRIPQATGPGSATPIAPGGLPGAPLEPFTDSPDGAEAYPPPFPPPMWPWPEEPDLVVGDPFPTPPPTNPPPVTPPILPPVTPEPPLPPTTPIPEPSTWLLWILGFLGVGGLLRRGRPAAARPSDLS
jgi:hypothetical protein